MSKSIDDLGRLYGLANRYANSQTVLNTLEVKEMATWIQHVLWMLGNASLNGWDSPAGKELLTLCLDAQDGIL